MKSSKIRIFFASAAVVVLALGVLAFTPFTGLAQSGTNPDKEPTVPDHTQALADALGVTLDDLQVAYEAASQTAMEQSINNALENGLITQDEADEMLSGDAHFGRHQHFSFSSVDMDALVAEELGISVEDYQAAQTEVFTAMIEQAVADGEMTQTAADLAIARRAAGDYFERARTSAYQDAVQNALDEGAIDQAQADLLLQNMDSGAGRMPFGGFGRMPFGGHGDHMRPHGEPLSGETTE
jgi:hypothetical protein